MRELLKQLMIITGGLLFFDIAFVVLYFVTCLVIGIKGYKDLRKRNVNSKDILVICSVIFCIAFLFYYIGRIMGMMDIVSYIK